MVLEHVMKKRKMQTAIFITIGVTMTGVVLIYVVNTLVGPPSTLGITDGKLAPPPTSPNCVSTQAEERSHWIAPLTFEGEADTAIQQVKDVLSTFPQATIITEQGNYLHAEFRSATLRFVDDVEFLVEPETNRIHFRSASRIGHSDLGVNRARMEHIRTLFAANSHADTAQDQARDAASSG